MNTKQGIGPVAIVIIFAVLIGGGYVAYQAYEEKFIKNYDNNQNSPAAELLQKATETADWKTYRNEKYGFEFKYPQGWYVENGTSSATYSEYRVFVSPFESQDTDISVPILFSVEISKGTKIPDDNKWKVARLDGRPALDTEWHYNNKNEQNDVSRGIFIDNTNMSVGMYYESKVSSDYFPTYNPKNSRTLLEKILSTFKFTN